MLHTTEEIYIMMKNKKYIKLFMALGVLVFLGVSSIAQARESRFCATGYPHKIKTVIWNEDEILAHYEGDAQMSGPPTSENLAEWRWKVHGEVAKRAADSYARTFSTFMGDGGAVNVDLDGPQEIFNGGRNYDLLFGVGFSVWKCFSDENVTFKQLEEFAGGDGVVDDVVVGRDGWCELGDIVKIRDVSWSGEQLMDYYDGLNNGDGRSVAPPGNSLLIVSVATWDYASGFEGGGGSIDGYQVPDSGTVDVKYTSPRSLFRWYIWPYYAESGVDFSILKCFTVKPGDNPVYGEVVLRPR